MKVSRSSWHFKVYKFSFDHGMYYDPTNLCTYFWRVVWGGFRGLMIVAVLSLLTFGVGSVVYTFPLQCLGVALALAGIITVSWNRSRIGEFFSRDTEEAEAPEPGLLRSFLRAKKDKVCPLIELEE